MKSGSNSVVECQLPKLDVAGSIPVSRSIHHNEADERAWLPCLRPLFIGPNMDLIRDSHHIQRPA